MAVAEQAELVVALKLKDQFSSSATKLQGKLQKLNDQTEQLQRGLGKVGQGLSTALRRSALLAGAGIGFLSMQVKAGLDGLVRFDAVNAQTAAVLESTGGAAGLTAEEIVAMTKSLEDLTGIEQEVSQEGANLLLTFTKIGKDVFPDTLAILNDMTTAMKTGTKEQAIQLGKALNDPIRGMSALSEVGVTFNETQRKTIERFQRTGQLAKAQRVILRELKKEFGGSAEAADKTFGGSLRRLNNSVTDLQMALAAPLVRPLNRLVGALRDVARSEDVQQGLTDLGEGIAGLFSDENINAGIGTIKSGFSFLRDLPWATIREGLQTTADIAGRAIGLFKSLPPELQTGLVTLLAANKLTGGLVASGLGDIATFLLRNLTTINAAVVNVIGRTVGTPQTPGPPIIGPATVAIAASLAASGIVKALIPETPGSTEVKSRLPIATGGIFGDAFALLLGALGFGGGGGGGGINRSPQASPGQGGQKLQGIVIDKLSTLAALGDKQNEQAANIWERLGTGNMSYAEANKKLNALLTKTDNQTTAIREQKTDVNLSPQINISAAQTGNAITLAATGSRIVIR